MKTQGVLRWFSRWCGVLTIFVGARAVPQRVPGTGTALSCAGLPAVAAMSWTHFVLDSDFKWLLLAPTVAWLPGLATYWIGSRPKHAGVALSNIKVDASIPAAQIYSNSQETSQ